MMRLLALPHQDPTSWNFGSRVSMAVGMPLEFLGAGLEFWKSLGIGCGAVGKRKKARALPQSSANSLTPSPSVSSGWTDKRSRLSAGAPLRLTESAASRQAADSVSRLGAAAGGYGIFAVYSVK